MPPINFLSILVSSVVSFAIGAAWYSPLLFGTEWMRLKGIKVKDIDEGAKRGMWKLYLFQLVSAIVFFVVMGFFVSATGSRSVTDGAFIGFVAWVGFSVTTAVGDMLWNKTPVKLALINEVCALVTWVIGAAIIGGWR